MEIIKHKDKWYLKSETGYREILATTNPELNYIAGRVVTNIPKLSKQFLQEWVKNPVDKVLVEVNGYGSHYFKNQIKTSPDNTVSVRFIEDDWDSVERKYGKSKGWEAVFPGNHTHSEFLNYLKENFSPPTEKLTK